MSTTNNNLEVMIPMSPNEQRSKIDDFILAFAQGKEAFETAGRIIVELVDSDPYVYTYIGEICPEMTPQLLRMFEDIGRGKVLLSLAFDGSKWAGVARRFALPLQARVEAEPIPLVVRTQDGSLDVRLVKLCDMTRDQLTQAVDKDRLRTEGQQRAMLDDQAAKAAIIDIKATAMGMPWTVKGGFVTFAAGTRVDRKTLLQLLTQVG